MSKKEPANKNAKDLKDAKEKEAKEVKDKEAKEAKELEEFVGYYEKSKVKTRYPYGENQESSLIEFENVDKVTGSVFIVGLSGVGMTSTVVSSYLIGVLNLPLIAVFNSPLLSAMCSIHKWSPTPSLRIYGDSSLCVAVGDQQLSAITNSALIWQITTAFQEFSIRHKCTHIITVDGLPIQGTYEKQIKKIARMMPNAEKQLDLERQNSLDNEEKEDPFKFAGYLTTSKEIGIALKQKGHKPIKTGQIIGVTGAMLALAYTSEDAPPITCILAPDPVNIPDQRGALLAIQLLRELYKLSQIDTTALEEECKRLLIKVQETISDIQQQVQRQQRGQPPPGMYL